MSQKLSIGDYILNHCNSKFHHNHSYVSLHGRKGLSKKDKKTSYILTKKFVHLKKFGFF